MTWNEKIKYILEHTPNIHKWYSTEQGWCYLSDKYGSRFKISKETSLWDIKAIINRIDISASFKAQPIER